MRRELGAIAGAIVGLGKRAARTELGRSDKPAKRRRMAYITDSFLHKLKSQMRDGLQGSGASVMSEPKSIGSVLMLRYKRR